MEDWQVIRERCVARGEPMKRVPRETGIALNTIRKYVQSSAPPLRCGAPTRTPVMAAYESDVDALLKQEANITANRIAQVLRERYPSFNLRERAVRNYVALRRRILHPREVFIRQLYAPSDQVQFAFKDVMASIAGEQTDLHLFTMRLSLYQSRRTRDVCKKRPRYRRQFAAPEAAAIPNPCHKEGRTTIGPRAFLAPPTLSPQGIIPT
jgi:transposase